MPLSPRSLSPRIDAAKAAVVACPTAQGRAIVRRWIRDHVDAHGNVDDAPPAERTWPAATLGLLVTLNAADLRFVRTWLLRRIDDAGELLIPKETRSTYQYPTSRDRRNPNGASADVD